MNAGLKENKNILLITFAFPPIGGSAVQRALKFAKYLPSFGWTPTVLTVTSAIFPVYGQVDIEEVNKDLKVYRTKFIDFLNIKKKFMKSSGFDKDINKPNWEPEGRKNSPLKFLMRAFNQYFLIPDDKIGWIPFAVKKGLKIIREENIDVIYTTGDPFSVFLIGYLLKKMTKKLWVLDYRDSWTDFSLPSVARGRYRQAVENFLEYRVLKKADKIISVSPLINKKLQSKYNKISKEKYKFLPNGYDSSDFKDIKKEKRGNDKFVITYTGIFNKVRSPEVFLKALSELLSESNAFKNNIEVRLIGASFDEDINQMLQKYNLNDNVKFLGYREHKECIKEIVNADALLLIQNYNNLEAFSGKLFEYLYSGNPILGVVPPEGCAAGVIKETRAGLVVENNTVEKIKKAIKELYFNREISPDREKIKEYDRFKITGKLAEVLDDI